MATLYKGKKAVKNETNIFLLLLLRALFPLSFKVIVLIRSIRSWSLQTSPLCQASGPQNHFRWSPSRCNSRLDHLAKGQFPIELSIHLWTSLDHQCLWQFMKGFDLFQALEGWKWDKKPPTPTNKKKSLNKAVPLNNGESKVLTVSENLVPPKEEKAAQAQKFSQTLLPSGLAILVWFTLATNITLLSPM